MPAGFEPVIVVLLAIVLDRAVGDPPNRFHPVAWIGALLRRGRARLCGGPPVRLFAAGAFVTLSVAAVAALAGWGIEASARGLGAVETILEAIALKLLLSLRDLRCAGLAVARELARGDLPLARRTLAWSLVSRESAALGEGHLASAAIESLAENLCDSFVAPVFFYLAFGLPGAAFYRAVNTADAMFGYRDGLLEYFGKTAARLDDVLNLIPARLAAVALVLGASLAGGDRRRAAVIMTRDHGRTTSPNAGWTLAAMAGALGVRFEKIGEYTLGDGDLPRPSDIPIAARILLAGAGVATAILVSATLLGVGIGGWLATGPSR